MVELENIKLKPSKKKTGASTPAKAIEERQQVHAALGVTWYGYAALIFAFVWIFLSTGIQVFLCTGITKMDLVKRIPQSFVCEWLI